MLLPFLNLKSDDAQEHLIMFVKHLGQNRPLSAILHLRFFHPDYSKTEVSILLCNFSNFLSSFSSFFLSSSPF